MSMDDIREYYTQAYIDYQLVWGVHRNHGVHLGFYDDEYDSHDGAVENMNRVLADTADVSPGDRILDVGCGVGGSSAWLAEHRDAEVVGSNITPSQLERAQSLAAARDLDGQVQFVTDDFTDMGFRDDSFDLVWGLESICHAEETTAFLTEAARVLAPGGRLVVADRFVTVRDLSPDQRQRMNHWLDGWAIPSLAHRDDFRSALKSTGFETVDFRDITEHTKPSSRWLAIVSALCYPGSRLLEFLRLRTGTQTKNVVAGYYQYLTLLDGLWTHGLFSASVPPSDSQ
jgi:tocopherol O-methyltransferase